MILLKHAEMIKKVVLQINLWVLLLYQSYTHTHTQSTFCIAFESINTRKTVIVNAMCSRIDVQ